jgi:hypothetical protein
MVNSYKNNVILIYIQNVLTFKNKTIPDKFMNKYQRKIQIMNTSTKSVNFSKNPK